MDSQFMRSRNYAPSAKLAPYIARHYVFSVDAPDQFELIDHLLSETAFIRVLLRGDWAAEVAPGEWKNVGKMVFFGPNSSPLCVRVRGGFRVIGMAFCPGGWRAVSDVGMDHYTNRMVPLAELWDERSAVLLKQLEALDAKGEDEAADIAIVAAVEAQLSAYLDARGWPAADKAMQQFELIARNGSTTLVRDAAAEVGLSSRSLERQCHASFGMSPKVVLRRSRFLDMASAMRGLSHPDEQELTELRYYDQSHLNREFRYFSKLTPRQFVKTPTPLLTAGLELRDLRKQEDALLLQAREQQD